MTDEIQTLTEIHPEFRPAEGRSIVYQIAEGEYRPAQIVKVWTVNAPRTCNIVVFADGSNDARYPETSEASSTNLVLWKTSRVLGEGVGQYLPRVPGPQLLTDVHHGDA